MDSMIERARAAGTPPEALGYEQEGIRLLASLCRELQRGAGGEPFYLDCRTAGRLVGVDHVTANRWLFLLCSDGLLVVVEPGQRNRATSYRYTGVLT